MRNNRAFVLELKVDSGLACGVMGHARERIVRLSHDALLNNGVFKLKDDKTGKELDLEFVDTHLPVRQLFRLHRFSRRRHQGPNLRHRFLVSDRDGTRAVGTDVGTSHVVP